MLSALLSLLIGALSYFLSSSLRGYKRRTLSLCEEIYALLLHIKLEVSCYLRPVGEILKGYSSPMLEEIGFLPVARREGLSRALVECADCRLSSEEVRLLSSLFSSLGTGYARDEIKLMEGVAQEFSRLLKERRSLIAKDIKLINTLCASAALGTLILLI